ncbi:MAG: S1 RNA-binding domain-containing protein, partial [Acidimicrobiia bacterium]
MSSPEQDQTSISTPDAPERQEGADVPEAPEAAAVEPPPAVEAETQGGVEAEYEPKVVTADDLGETSLADAIADTIVDFDEGDIMTGKVVRVDKDEVLLDIGYKSEGVIPVRELSIRHDVNPHEVVTVGDVIEALVLQKEDKDGRLILSKKRAQ